MKNLLISFFFLFFSANLAAMELKAEQLSLDLTINEPVVKLSNGLLHLAIPLEKLKDAIILTSNNDPVVIFDRNKKIAFSMNSTGKKLLLDGFKNDQKLISNKISDIPSIVFGQKEQKIKNSADEEFAKIISNIKELMLSADKNSKSFYLTANGKTIYFLIGNSQNHAFIVNEKQKDYFTTIISDNINKNDFIDLIVKGALQ